MSETNAALERLDSAFNQVTVEEKVFELAQRKAAIYAKSSLVPKEYQNNIGNVLIAENMARRMGADTLMVMQNLYVVHGKPGWSAQFLIASFNSNGRFSAIKYRFKGEEGTPEWACQAYCTELSTGEEIAGTTVSYAMALSEGWVNKTGSKWKTMPEQMFRYRAATFMIRSTAPEIGMGLLTKEELEDMPADRSNAPATPGIAGVKDRLKLVQADDDEPKEDPIADEAEPPPIEAEVITDRETITSEPPDTDETAEETASEAELDPAESALETLRDHVKEMFAALTPARQKDIQVGRAFIKSANKIELDEYKEVLESGSF